MKLILLLALLVGVTLTQAATNAVPASAEQEKLRIEAGMLIRQGLYTEAEIRLQQLAEWQPNNILIRDVLAEVRMLILIDALEKQLAAIRLPSVEFHDAKAQDAIGFLRQESAKFTADKIAINFVWQVPATAAVATVTLSLKNVPLGDALKYVTQLAGLRYRAEAHAIIIYKPEPTTSSNAKPE